MVCGTVAFAGGSHNPVARAMPSCLQVPIGADDALAATVQLLFAEALAVRCGRQIVVDRLFEVLLVHLSRWAMAQGAAEQGMLASLAHPQLRHALTAMHAAPADHWTLEALAAVAGMSRTRFAETFRDTVGATPADYLAAWRIAVAQDLLRRGRPLKLVAGEVGYDSPASFTRAFKARPGITPRQLKQPAVEA